MKTLRSFPYLGHNESNNKPNDIDKIASALLPIQIHQTEFIESETGAIPKRNSIKQEDYSKVNSYDYI